MPLFAATSSSSFTGAGSTLDAAELKNTVPVDRAKASTYTAAT
ncbi:MAG: hypothetical protein ACRDPT_14440 [Streptomycetales bacterium]